MRFGIFRKIIAGKFKAHAMDRKYNNKIERRTNLNAPFSVYPTQSFIIAILLNMKGTQHALEHTFLDENIDRKKITEFLKRFFPFLF